jgi:hypothetical protein
MGCSYKAIDEDEEELKDALERTGLYRDKKYGNIKLYSSDSIIVKKCAAANMTKNQTIEQIILNRHVLQAKIEFNQEMEKRATLQQLTEEFG